MRDTRVWIKISSIFNINTKNKKQIHKITAPYSSLYSLSYSYTFKSFIKYIFLLKYNVIYLF